MKLTLKDRVVILNSVLPEYDTRANTKRILSIVQKIDITSEENMKLITNRLGNGQVEIALKEPDKNIDAWTNEIEYDFADDEIQYLKERVEFIDRNGMFSTNNINTYEKLLSDDEAAGQ